MLRNMALKAVRDARSIFQMGFRLLRWDYQTLLIFEFMYKLCTLVLVVPLLKMMLQWAIDLAGMPVLSQFNILTLIRRPWCIPILILLACILVFFEFIELTVIIHYFDAAKRKEKVTIAQLLRCSWNQTLRICQPRNICLLLFVAVVIPLTNLTFSSGLLSTIRIPGFISEYMRSRNVLMIPYTILGALAIIICYRWIFSLHEYTLNGKSFGQACESSNHMVKGRMIRIILVFLEWSLVLAVVGYAFYFVFLLLSALGIKCFWQEQYESMTFWSWYNLVGKWKIVVTDGFTILAKYTWISAAWYYISQKKDPEAEVKKLPVRVERSRSEYWLRSMWIVLLIGLCAYFSGANSKWNGTISICAHRGAVTGIPENTLASIQKLVRDNVASAAEIDVRQLKDGTIILMHDDSFQRTAGINRRVQDVTYEEALQYDVGAYCGEEWEGTRVTRLEEVLDYLQDILWFDLVIEVKSGGDMEMVRQIVEMIEDRGMEERCIIASMDYEVLQNVKKIDQKMTTQLITFIAYGKLYTLEDVDIYSVEASFVTQKLVKALRTLNKPLYVWTVNQSKELRRLQALNVDCIITDEAYWADYMLSSPADDRLINAMVRALLNDSEPEAA